MNASKLVTLTTSLVALLAGVACGDPAAADDVGESAPEVKAASSTIVHGKTRYFAGTFDVPLKDGRVSFAFDVSDIDWEAGTAVWNAKVTSTDAPKDVTDDVDKPMKVLIARCPGCSRFSAEGTYGPLAVLTIDAERLGSLEYSGIPVQNLKVSSTSTSPKGSKAQSGSTTGACRLVCGESVSCVDKVAKGDCNVDRFERVPRCPYEIKFESGAKCAP